MKVNNRAGIKFRRIRVFSKVNRINTQIRITTGYHFHSNAPDTTGFPRITGVPLHQQTPSNTLLLIKWLQIICPPLSVILSPPETSLGSVPPCKQGILNSLLVLFHEDILCSLTTPYQAPQKLFQASIFSVMQLKLSFKCISGLTVYTPPHNSAGAIFIQTYWFTLRTQHLCFGTQKHVLYLTGNTPSIYTGWILIMHPV